MDNISVDQPANMLALTLGCYDDRIMVIFVPAMVCNRQPWVRISFKCVSVWPVYLFICDASQYIHHCVRLINCFDSHRSTVSLSGMASGSKLVHKISRQTRWSGGQSVPAVQSLHPIQALFTGKIAKSTFFKILQALYLPNSTKVANFIKLNLI